MVLQFKVNTLAVLHMAQHLVRLLLRVQQTISFSILLLPEQCGVAIRLVFV
jgi:hypothetical protein